MKRYTARDKDTIFKIAEYFYYDYSLWPLVYYTNEGLIGADPLVLNTGVNLKIPDVVTYDRQHTVIEGDTSVSLSLKYYGVKYYYRAIDEANDFPPFLVVGRVYKIPALCKEIMIQAANDLRREIGIITDF